MRLLIGIIGKMHSGKTTVSNMIKDNYPNKWNELAFAEPLKSILKDLFFLEDIHVHGPMKDQKHPELNVMPRELLQIVGTDLFRNTLPTLLPQLNLQGHSLWIWHMKQRLENIDSNVIISDVRFPDEMQVIKSMGGFIIEIKRPNSHVIHSLDNIKAHSSEQLNTNNLVNYTINNDGSLDDLQFNVIKIIEEITH